MKHGSGWDWVLPLFLGRREEEEEKNWVLQRKDFGGSWSMIGRIPGMYKEKDGWGRRGRQVYTAVHTAVQTAGGREAGDSRATLVLSSLRDAGEWAHVNRLRSQRMSKPAGVRVGTWEQQKWYRGFSSAPEPEDSGVANVPGGDSQRWPVEMIGDLGSHKQTSPSRTSKRKQLRGESAGNEVFRVGKEEILEWKPQWSQ